MTKDEVIQELDALRYEIEESRLYRVIVEAKRIIEEGGQENG